MGTSGLSMAAYGAISMAAVTGDGPTPWHCRHLVTRWPLIAVVTGDVLAILSAPKRAGSHDRSKPQRHCHCGRPRRGMLSPRAGVARRRN